MLLNELSFAGHVGRDAEIRHPKSGTKMVVFNLCVSQKAKDGYPEKSTWVSVRAYNWQADVAATIKKGDNVFVKGPLSIEDYVSRDGLKKTAVSMTAFHIAICTKNSYKPNQEDGGFPVGIALPQEANTSYLEDVPF